MKPGHGFSASTTNLTQPPPTPALVRIITSAELARDFLTYQFPDGIKVDQYADAIRRIVAFVDHVRSQGVPRHATDMRDNSIYSSVVVAPKPRKKETEASEARAVDDAGLCEADGEVQGTGMTSAELTAMRERVAFATRPENHPSGCAGYLDRPDYEQTRENCRCTMPPNPYRG